MVLAVLCLGVIMAGVVFFASGQQSQTAKASGKVEQGQAAYEALALAAKRIQSMYANEAGCAPESLDVRLSNLPSLSSTPTNLTYNNVVPSYIPANPSASVAADKANRCTSASNKGCRQLAIPVDNFVYVVTASAVAADGAFASSGLAAGQDCPRDANVTLTVAANGNVYIQRVTLTNICTLKSCSGTGAAGFDSPASIVHSNVTHATTLACTGAYAGISARHYGAGFTSNASTTLTMDDLRWARKYLETGGDDVGETSFLYSTAVGWTGNGACPAVVTDLSNGQCHDKPCFPFFDLNRDGRNNEEDLAILENFMRGYLTTLPVNDGML
jgi:hypothetical protein